MTKTSKSVILRRMTKENQMNWFTKTEKERLADKIEEKKVRYNQLVEALNRMKESIKDDYEELLKMGE